MNPINIPAQAPGAATEPEQKKSLREPSQTAPAVEPQAPPRLPDKDSSKAPSPEPANRPAEAPEHEEDKTDAPAEPHIG